MKEIITFENFLSKELYNEAFETAKYLLERGQNLFCTNAWWDNKIVEDSFPVLIHNIDRNSSLFKNLKVEIESKTESFVNQYNLMFYYWTRFSYIPWHQDYLDKNGFTLYLNDHWERNYGGYFLYEDPNNETEIKTIIPKKNLAVIQKGGVWHTTTPVNYNGRIRFTIQAFLDKN